MKPAADPEVFIWDSRKLWNVAEMIKHVCSMLCALIQDLLGTLIMVGARIRDAGESSSIAENDKKFIYGVLANAQHECEYLGLEDAANHITIIETRLKNNCSLGTIHVELQNLNTAIMLGLTKREFAFIRPELASYFENDKLLGEATEKFSAASQDAKDAGNCLATELYTASVFHMMRVAEHGLRRLARRLNVKPIHSGKSHPIEFADWEKVITAIKQKIDVIRRLPIGVKRKTQLEMYSDAADHCVFMKDIWRNDVSHARKPYIETEALAVVNRVRDFMIFLGKQL